MKIIFIHSAVVCRQEQAERLDALPNLSSNNAEEYFEASEFPSNTLYHICYGLQCYLRWNGKLYINFLNDKAFADFKSSLDAEMKRLQSAGVGSKQKQAEPLTVGEETIGRCHTTVIA